MPKKPFFYFLIIFMIASCSTSLTTIDISPKIALPQQDPSLMGITISISGVDRRKDQSLAKLVHDSQFITLFPSRDLRFLLQEVLEKQMISRGYMIGPYGSVNLQIVLNNLYADIFRGNIRHNVSVNADIVVIANAISGNKMIKNYHANYAVKGICQSMNTNITDAVNGVLSNIIADMAKDTSIHDFIKKNLR